MFGKLFSKKEPSRFCDKSYIDWNAKKAAMLAIANEDEQAVFLCWFRHTLEDLKDFFRQHQQDESRIREARTFHPGNNQRIIFTEHHPLHAKEVELINLWKQESFTVFNSMDEPFLLAFGGERIARMMRAMGIKEEEAIEHRMISQSILNAQEKIAKKVMSESPASSQAEWMKKNVNGK